MAPNQVNLISVGSARRNVKSKIKVKFYAGNLDRVSKSRRTFRKGMFTHLD